MDSIDWIGISFVLELVVMLAFGYGCYRWGYSEGSGDKKRIERFAKRELRRRLN